MSVLASAKHAQTKQKHLRNATGILLFGTAEFAVQRVEEPGEELNGVALLPGPVGLLGHDRARLVVFVFVCVCVRDDKYAEAKINVGVKVCSRKRTLFLF